MSGSRNSVLAAGLCAALAIPTHASTATRSSPAPAALAGTWTALGAGLAGPASSHVNDLAVLGSQLIAAGTFTQAGGQPANRIAAWDGAAWSPLGSGLNGAVNAIAVNNGQLVAVGGFTNAGGIDVNHVALWSGSAWSALGAGLNGNATAVAFFDGRIFAARTVGLPPFGVQQAYVEWWNGTSGIWFSSATLGPPLNSDWITIRVLEPIGTRLYLGSDANSAPGWTSAYNGTSWSGLGEACFAVSSFQQYGIGLFAGGYDALVESYTPPTTWTPLDPNWAASCGVVYDMEVYNGRLIVGGSSLSPTCLPATVNAWDGSAWSAVGTGMNSGVTALTVFGGHLIAAGYFTIADGNPAGLIAQWTEPPVAVRKTTLGGIKALYSRPAH